MALAFVLTFGSIGLAWHGGYYLVTVGLFVTGTSYAVGGLVRALRGTR